MNDNIDILKEEAKKKLEEGKIKHAVEILEKVIFLLRREKRDEEADLIETRMQQYIDAIFNYYFKENNKRVSQ